MTKLRKIFGPRVSVQEMAERRIRFMLPTLLLGTAGFLLVVSIFVPYWGMVLNAPQYPGGLKVQSYLNRIVGDVGEIDGLNHYIGMRPLAEAAQLEQSLSVAALTVIALLLVGAIFIHSKWAALVSLPAMLFPAVFLGDMYYWLHNFGTNLDPKAPLSSSIKPFTPPVLGRGYVGQFSTDAYPGPGLVLATIASVLIFVGLLMHRRAYKPLVDRQQTELDE